jgi:hypothetical protein
VIIQGRMHSQVVLATAAVCPASQVKMTSKAPMGAQSLTLTGYIRITTGTAYRTMDNGQIHPWQPCYHFYAALGKALSAMPGGPFHFILHKHTLKPGMMNSKGKLALQKKGLSCAHGELDPTGASGLTEVSATATASVASKPVAKLKPAPVPKGQPLTIPMLDGAPMEPGQTASVAGIKGKMRPVYAITTSLYLLEECKIGAAKIPAATCAEIPDHLLMRAAHAVQWRNRVTRYAEHYANTLARNFFDYLTIASFGEARYGQGNKYTFGGVNMGAGRSHCYQIALKYDPRDLLPKLVHAFNEYHWGGSYGGKKWGKIAETASMFFLPGFRDCPIAFIDHCVDLAHNGGLAFNKGYLIANPDHESAYMAMLTEKRNGSLLESKLIHPVTSEVADLLSTGVGLGIVRRPKANFKIVPDVAVPTLTWGDEHIALYDGHPSGVMGESSDHDDSDDSDSEHDTPTEEQPNEVYPER